MLTRHFSASELGRRCTQVLFRRTFLLGVARLAIFAASVASLAAGTATAQGARDYSQPQMTHETRALRSFHGAPAQIRRSFRSDGEARSVLVQVLNAAGLAGMEDRIHLRASAETSDALATIEGDQRLVFYNADFMQRMKEQTGEYWSLVAILAHEVGHHVRFHTIIAGRNHDFELEADYQAGFILRRMGASREQALSAFRQFPEAATETHPGRAQRIQQVTLGWIAGGETPGSPKQPAPPSASAAPAPRSPSTPLDTTTLSPAQKADVVKLLDAAVRQLAHHNQIGIAVRNITHSIPRQYREDGLFFTPVVALRTRSDLPPGERGAVLVAYQKIAMDLVTTIPDKNRLIAALEAAKAAYR